MPGGWHILIFVFVQMSYASCLVRTEDLTADSLVLFIAIRE